ncbi:gp053 [Rhodococcus phage ReqiPepy6]|uniref:Gp053 n=1 Tax=Rhodococcus phage ReqiPepy6 TaxID=691965 RepID=D4P7G4_9CAUD|nr:gp053 [Rhodococcus phage ReqiPepy6]ADD80944.1 gp053 [Rhodococcus phage ReqiPepy6]
MSAYNSFNDFLANNPQWIIFISIALPWVGLMMLVMFFEKGRKKHKAVRKAYKAGELQKRPSRRTNLTVVEPVSNRKDVPSDYFDRVNEFRASL